MTLRVIRTVPVIEAGYRTADGHPFLVCRAHAADAEAIIANINTVCAEEVYLLTACFTPTPAWERALYACDAHPDHLLLVPEVEGQVVGWCRVFPEASGVGEVGIGLTPPYREIGIGTALMSEAIAWAQAQRLARLILSVFATNARAIGLFHKMGFAVTGRRDQQHRSQGSYVDELLMERPLAP